jgi:hypothetical protein
VTPAEIRKADDRRIRNRIFAIEIAGMRRAADITPALAREHKLLVHEAERRGIDMGDL